MKITKGYWIAPEILALICVILIVLLFVGWLGLIWQRYGWPWALVTVLAELLTGYLLNRIKKQP